MCARQPTHIGKTERQLGMRVLEHIPVKVEKQLIEKIFLKLCATENYKTAVIFDSRPFDKDRSRSRPYATLCFATYIKTHDAWISLMRQLLI